MKNIQKQSTYFLFALAISFLAAFLFNACYGYGGEEDCSDIDPDARYPLSKAQKKFGNFKMDSSTRYTHSDGYEFNLKTVKDTLYWQERDFSPCIGGKEEIHEIIQKADYPIFYLSVSLNSENMSISLKNEGFYALLDSAGIDDESDSYHSVNYHDSLDINGTTYKDIQEICNIDEEETKSCIFISKKDGILKVKFKDGTEFSIVKTEEARE